MLLQYPTTVISAVQQTTKHWGKSDCALDEKMNRVFFFSFLIESTV